VACSNAPAKAVGRALRGELLPPVVSSLDGWQFGAVAGGGTDFPSHAIRTFMAYGDAAGLLHAVIFADVEPLFIERGPKSRWGR